mmetsp:Transcript_1540/g.3250  ORF Transcript_1540/g.3250 Transcript_1540/m.3250 type:complete len:557 (+) Transcript_1540:94-1764(+)
MDSFYELFSGISAEFPWDQQQLQQQQQHDSREASTNWSEPRGDALLLKLAVEQGVSSLSRMRCLFSNQNRQQQQLCGLASMGERGSLRAAMVSAELDLETTWSMHAEVIEKSTSYEARAAAYSVLVGLGSPIDGNTWAEDADVSGVLEKDEDEQVAKLMPRWLQYVLAMERDDDDADDVVGLLLSWAIDVDDDGDDHGHDEEDQKRYARARKRVLGLMRIWSAVFDIFLCGGGDEDCALFRRVVSAFLRIHFDTFRVFLDSAARLLLELSRIAKSSSSRSIENVELSLLLPSAACSRDGNADAAHAAQNHEEERYARALEVTCGESVYNVAFRAFVLALHTVPVLSRRWFGDSSKRLRAEIDAFVKARVSRELVRLDINQVKALSAAAAAATDDGDAQAAAEDPLDAGGVHSDLRIRGSVLAREVSAVYEFSDVGLEICFQLPESYPLSSVVVESRGTTGLSEARWRKMVLGMTTLLSLKDGTLVEAIELWRANLDKHFDGVEECPICYSVLHISTAAVPKMKCRTCKHKFHSACLCKWFGTSNSSACPLCRSPFA